MVSDNFEIVRRRFRILIFLAVIICRRLTDLPRRFLAQFLRIFRYGNIIFPHDRFISTRSAVMIICNAHQFIVRQDPRFIGSLQRIKFSERRTAFAARKPDTHSRRHDPRKNHTTCPFHLFTSFRIIKNTKRHCRFWIGAPFVLFIILASDRCVISVLSSFCCKSVNILSQMPSFVNPRFKRLPAH